MVLLNSLIFRNRSCFYQGASDQQIVTELGIGSRSTIRNHRFALREKEKQARVLLAIMELLEERLATGERLIDIPRSVQQVDERLTHGIMKVYTIQIIWLQEQFVTALEIQTRMVVKTHHSDHCLTLDRFFHSGNTFDAETAT